MSLKKMKNLGALLAVATAVSLSGCGDSGLGGIDGVQLNGKIFDAVGLNTGSTKTGDPKMAARQPLVVPPGLESLPPPGSGKADAPKLAEVQDPDAKAKMSRAELERQQQDYCSKNYEPAVQRGDQTADLVEGPMGPCRGSVFTVLKKWTSKENADDDQDAQ